MIWRVLFGRVARLALNRNSEATGQEPVVCGPPDGVPSDHADSATCEDPEETLFGPTQFSDRSRQ
jgi:hypothetical protein